MKNQQNTSNTNKVRVSFASIDSFVESNIVAPTETKVSGKDYYDWGEGNDYPNYLLDLYRNATTLRSIIDGMVEYIKGDSISIEQLRDMGAGQMNSRGDTITDQVEDIARDYQMYGGFALQVIRGHDGEVSEVYHIDMRFLRMNKDCDVFYYCEGWGKSWNRDRVFTYPKYMQNLEWEKLDENERERHASSILFIKDIRTQTYPSPKYAAAVKSCEIERCIDEYHLNSINNGFAGSAIINFNNGVPEDEIKKEIEKSFNEKFGGHQNAGRVMFSWNADRTSATTVSQLEIQDFGERYQALDQNSKQKIFTAFRANPNLFGIPTENLGFSSEEYEQSFKLFNRTQVRPIQKKIADAYDKIYNKVGVLTVVPFSLDGETEKIVK